MPDTVLYISPSLLFQLHPITMTYYMASGQWTLHAAIKKVLSYNSVDYSHTPIELSHISSNALLMIITPWILQDYCIWDVVYGVQCICTNENSIPLYGQFRSITSYNKFSSVIVTLWFFLFSLFVFSELLFIFNTYILGTSSVILFCVTVIILLAYLGERVWNNIS